MSKIRFSIIIPTYNSILEVERAIKSVKTQKCTNYEIIVIDDCSTDGTYEKLKKNYDIKLIRNKVNMKAGGSRNRGLEIASGEYIIFLDADDYLLDEYTLEKIDSTIGIEKPDVVYLGFQKGDESLKKYIPTQESEQLSIRLTEWKYPNIWDVCWNREFIQKNNIKFIEERYYEDFNFYYQALIMAKTFKVADFVTHVYDNKKDSMTAITDIQKLQDLYLNVVDLLEYIKNVEKTKRAIIIPGILEVITNSERLLRNYQQEIK